MDSDKEKYKDALRVDIDKARKEVERQKRTHRAETLMGVDEPFDSEPWQVCEHVAHARVWPLEPHKKEQWYATTGAVPAPRFNVPTAKFNSALRVIRWSKNLNDLSTAQEAEGSIFYALERDQKTFQALTPGGLRYALCAVAWAAYVKDIYDGAKF
jgi:hypothetical protein